MVLNLLDFREETHELSILICMHSLVSLNIIYPPSTISFSLIFFYLGGCVFLPIR